MNADPSSLTQDVEERLDHMLAIWAERHQITGSQAETIRRDILRAARHPGFEWKSERSRGLPLAAIGATTVPAGLATVYRTLAEVIPGWPTPNLTQHGDYRPYLRVA